MKVWTAEEIPERFDDMLDAAERDGPQIIGYGDKTMILLTKEDYQAHLAGKTFPVDEYLLALAR